MLKIAFAAATATALFAVAPTVTGTTAAHAQELKVAQGVDVEVGRDRDDRRLHRDRDDVTVGVGPRGIRVGPRHEHCRTTTTYVERGDGRRVKRTERRCD
jgi:hypothetical protein